MAYSEVTVEGATVTAKNDGYLHRQQFGGQDILSSTPSLSGNTLILPRGYMVIGGRQIDITSNTSISLSPTVTTGVGRVIAQIDLTATPVFSFQEEYGASISAFSTLTQGDVNLGGTLYQCELVRFSVSSSTATSLTRTLNDGLAFIRGGQVPTWCASLEDFYSTLPNGSVSENYVGYSQTLSDRPANGSAIATFHKHGSTLGYIFFLSTTGATAWIKVLNSSTWGSWKQITMV